MSGTPNWHQIEQALWTRLPKKDLGELLKTWGRYEDTWRPYIHKDMWVAESNGLKFAIPDDVRARFWEWLKISKYVL